MKMLFEKKNLKPFGQKMPMASFVKNVSQVFSRMEVANACHADVMLTVPNRPSVILTAFVIVTTVWKAENVINVKTDFTTWDVPDVILVTATLKVIYFGGHKTFPDF